MDRLRQNVYVVDVVEAKKITDFLNSAYDPHQILSVAGVSKGIHDAEFKSEVNRFTVREAVDDTGWQNLATFMKEMGLSRTVLRRDEFDSAEERPEWWRPYSPAPEVAVGSGIPKNSDAYRYLTPLIVIWAPNTPGKLDAILRAIREYDLLFVETASIGEHGLIYVLPKHCVPQEAEAPLGGEAFQLVKSVPLGASLLRDVQEAVRGEKCVVREVLGLLLKIHDTPEGLLAALEGLAGEFRNVGAARLNIEGVHAFSFKKGIGLAFVLMKERDLGRAIEAHSKVSAGFGPS
jgi:hypothetical protein